MAHGIIVAQELHGNTHVIQEMHNTSGSGHRRSRKNTPPVPWSNGAKGHVVFTCSTSSSYLMGRSEVKLPPGGATLRADERTGKGGTLIGRQDGERKGEEKQEQRANGVRIALRGSCKQGETLPSTDKEAIMIAREKKGALLHRNKGENGSEIPTARFLIRNVGNNQRAGCPITHCEASRDEVLAV